MSFDNQATKMILAFPREIKLGLLEDALKEDNFGIFVQLSKILLEAPITLGGIETEAIEEVRKKYFKVNL